MLEALDCVPEIALDSESDREPTDDEDSDYSPPVSEADNCDQPGVPGPSNAGSTFEIVEFSIEL
jgi:hypothetical protein